MHARQAAGVVDARCPEAINTEGSANQARHRTPQAGDLRVRAVGVQKCGVEAMPEPDLGAAGVSMPDGWPRRRPRATAVIAGVLRTTRVAGGVRRGQRTGIW